MWECRLCLHTEQFLNAQERLRDFTKQLVLADWNQNLRWPAGRVRSLLLQLYVL
jgi:hypothetical protein